MYCFSCLIGSIIGCFIMSRLPSRQQSSFDSVFRIDSVRRKKHLDQFLVFLLGFYRRSI